MLSVTNLSGESIHLLKLRGQSDQQVKDFAALLENANNQFEQGASAKEVLASMSRSELNLLQKSAGLVNKIKIDSLSDEGARNLFAHPDKTGLVDLNNDGLVEVADARMMTFPPVNAPASVHEAWENATSGMSKSDKMVLELQMHTQVYGVRINDEPTKQALPPGEQWSTKGWKELIEQLNSSLEFAVSMDGWTRWNVLKKGFIDRFETELGKMVS